MTQTSAAGTTEPDLTGLKTRQQQTWASGDYAVVGSTLQIVGEQLCESVDLRPGQRVLDVATGNGGTALAAARRYCSVTGVDYVPSLLDRARDRARADGLGVVFEEGDAEALPYDADAFDVVMSTFGIMFTADHRRAASEALRVVRPGGTIAMANWVPDGFIGQLFKAIAAHVSPAPGAASPALWGTEDYLRDLFTEGVADVSTARREFVFRYHSADHFIDVFRGYYGPVLKAFAALDDPERGALEEDLRDLLTASSVSRQQLIIPSGYVEALVATTAEG